MNAESVSRGRVAELEQVVCDLQEEREILKRSNDRLMKRCACVVCTYTCVLRYE